jgi:hypothetical protein
MKQNDKGNKKNENPTKRKTHYNPFPDKNRHITVSGGLWPDYLTQTGRNQFYPQCDSLNCTPGFVGKYLDKQGAFVPKKGHDSFFFGGETLHIIH